MLMETSLGKEYYFSGSTLDKNVLVVVILVVSIIKNPKSMKAISTALLKK